MSSVNRHIETNWTWSKLSKGGPVFRNAIIPCKGGRIWSVWNVSQSLQGWVHERYTRLFVVHPSPLQGSWMFFASRWDIARLHCQDKVVHIKRANQVRWRARVRASDLCEFKATLFTTNEFQADRALVKHFWERLGGLGERPRDYKDGSMVKTPCYSCRGPGSLQVPCTHGEVPKCL